MIEKKKEKQSERGRRYWAEDYDQQQRLEGKKGDIKGTSYQCNKVWVISKGY